MAVYSVRVYNIDPFFVFSQTPGGSATYTGPTASDGSATITDNGAGGDDLTLEDFSSGETATADVTVGGTTYVGVAVEAEESWTLEDSVTGEQFQMVTFHFQDGGTDFYLTLSEIPLVNGRDYETITFDNDPEADTDAVFTYSDYITDVDDGTVTGTSGDDVIDGSYTGDY